MAVVGVAIWRVAVLVLVRVMVCWVEVGAGDVVEDEGGGVEREAGVGAPKPVSVAVADPAEVARVRVPERWPVAVGAKAISTKQEAVAASAPVQVAPPVG